MKSKISRKLILYFGATLMVFTLVISVVFLLVFRYYVISENETKLREKAVTIASTISQSVDLVRPSGGMGMLLRILYGNSNEDVWVVDRNTNIITRGMGQHQSITYTQLPKSAQEVIENVLGGQTQFSEDFSAFLDGTSLTVATPLFDSNNDIIGAVLVHTQITGLSSGVQAASWIMGVSLLFALGIAIVMGMLFSISFSKPLNQMAEMTSKLSEGRLDVRNDINQNDEVGQLAENLNMMADKLQASELQREQLNQIRKDFMATVSHELKTPLTVLQGSLEALMEDIAKDPQQIQKYYHQMHDETLALSRLTNDLLELTRLSSTDFKIEKQRVLLSNPLNSAIEAAKIKGKDKEIAWTVHKSESIEIMADEGRVRQMILIILDNAIKFSPIKGQITVTVDGDTLRICDQGSGVSPEDLPFIFDRFYRNKDASHLGSGLGLAIADQIAKRHDIHIEVTSQPHVNTCFALTFNPIY